MRLLGRRTWIFLTKRWKVLNTTGSNRLDIFKSLLLIGGSSAIALAGNLIRNKALAIFSGPSGVGTYGYIAGIVEIASLIIGLGMGTVGIRLISQSNADPTSTILIIRAMQKITWLTGGVGVLLMIFGVWWCLPITLRHQMGWPLWCLISCVVLLAAKAMSATSLIQGTRHLNHLAKSNILSAILGISFGIPLFWLFPHWSGEINVLLGGLVGFITLFYFSHQITKGIIKTGYHYNSKPLEQQDNIKDVFFHKRNQYMDWKKTAVALISMPIMLSELAVAGYPVAQRLVIAKSQSIADLGLFFAANSVSIMLVYFIISALSLDLYPKLSAQAECKVKFQGILIEHLRASYLIAFPSLGIIILFADIWLQGLYSAPFRQASHLLVWLALSSFGRIGIATVKVVLLAKGLTRWSMFYDVGFMSLGVALMIPMTQAHGLLGTSLSLVIVSAIYFLISCWLLLGKLEMLNLKDIYIEYGILHILLLGLVFFCIFFKATPFLWRLSLESICIGLSYWRFRCQNYAI